MSSCSKAPARALPCAVSGAVFITAASVVAFAATPAALPNIRVTEGRLSVRVVNVSLCYVIDGIAAQTGMKVIYDGPPPQQRVSVSVIDETPAAVLGTVLESGGVPYAMGLDRSRTRVETLVIGERKEPPARVEAAPPAALPSITDGFDLPENPPGTEYPDEPEEEKRPSGELGP